MRQYFIAAVALIFVLCTGALAQRNVTQVLGTDPVLEQDAKHNLDVAWQAFTLKKAYKGVLLRFEETYAAYPTFSKIDEFLYLAGMSSYFLSVNAGKQKVDLKNPKEKEKFAPAKLRADAKAYLSLFLEKNPESKYRREAEQTLKSIEAN